MTPRITWTPPDTGSTLTYLCEDGTWGHLEAAPGQHSVPADTIPCPVWVGRVITHYGDMDLVGPVSQPMPEAGGMLWGVLVLVALWKARA